MNHTLINIGRQFGSGGKSIATAVGKALGIAVYDHELIVQAAVRSGFSRELFERGDEHSGLFGLAGFFSSGRFGLSRNYLGSDHVFEIQSQVIRELAQKEAAVFVGRASDYILRDFDCLDVFICAPLEDRIRRVCERTGLDPDKAEERILRTDRSRADFYNSFTLGDWGVASNYDLCIDSSLLGIEGSAQTIIEFGRRAGLIQ